MAWATIDQVEEWIGVPQDSRMVDALDVSLAWCNRTRPDLDPATTPPADVTQAVVLYAALLYRERTAPQGFATYSELGGPGEMDASTAMINIYRLIGSRKPVAR